MKFKITRLDKSTTQFDTEREAHVALGMFAGQNNLDVHIHAGEFTVDAVSIAHEKGGDPLLTAKAVLRLA